MKPKAGGRGARRVAGLAIAFASALALGASAAELQSGSDALSALAQALDGIAQGGAPPANESAPPAAAPGGEDDAFFKTKIEPILAENCRSCHGVDKQKSDLRLDTRAAALRGGLGGAAIVPGDPDKSRLIQAVRYGGDLEMPPNGKISDEAIRALEEWVKRGAPWPVSKEEEARSEAERKERQWAFEKAKRSDQDHDQERGWGRNGIDRFVLARLQKAGLEPSPEADRATLIRRASLDLIGLAPTFEEIEAFKSDPDPQAYEKLVDRLLASPRHGERWGQHWLDVARFAETNGFEMNQPRPNAWRYRDWVIRALNEDKPYDRFVMEQIAGDSLGADEATGFLVCGAWDEVKSPDPELTAQQRMDELHDMVSNVGGAFLGLTIGCARCHNHKFDPITQQDYYKMQAVFAGVQHGERELDDGKAAERAAKAEERKREFYALDKALAAYEPLAAPAPSPTPAASEGAPAPTVAKPARAPVHATVNTERFAPVEARYVRFTILETNSGEPCVDELEVFTAEETPRNVALASAGGRPSSSGNFPDAVKHRLDHINDGIYGNDHSWISNEAGKGWVQVELAKPERIERAAWGRDRESKFADRLATRYKIETAMESPERAESWRVVASSEDRRPFKALAPPEPSYSFAGLDEEGASALMALVAARKKLSAEVASAAAAPKAYAGRFEQPGPSHLLYRGEATQKREQVSPGGIARIAPPLELPADSPEKERRLALAKWIASPENPLTARVIVNRLWQRHFGEGIVATPSDFGANGARPSHPEMLDWLADELVARGWSLKAIHRLIVTSAAYRQSSAPRAEALKVDAGDRLLWRFAPRRLEAEPIRDAILAASGTLDLNQGGPGYSPFEPNTNYVRVYAPRKDFSREEWRRMVYQTRVRMRLDGTFGAFDCPDGGQAAPRRTSSTTPLQALNLLNSSFIVQQAGLFAERIEKESQGAAPADAARRAFRLALGREAEPDEAAASAKLIERDGLKVFCRALLNANEFLYLQ